MRGRPEVTRSLCKWPSRPVDRQKEPTRRAVHGLTMHCAGLKGSVCGAAVAMVAVAVAGGNSLRHSVGALHTTDTIPLSLGWMQLHYDIPTSRRNRHRRFHLYTFVG